MSRNSARGFAVVSATAVTTVGAVMGVAQAGTAQSGDEAAAPAGDATLLADIPAGAQAQVQTVSLTRQADTQAVAADAVARKSAREAARKQAAQAAEAKRKAAEEKAREAKAASGDFPVQSSYTAAQVQAIARQIVPSGQFQCFSNIVNHESTWNYLAVNPSSGAYGLVQALPGSKMASAGADWRTNPATQIKWGLNYMNVRYGSPCDAWAYWQAHGNY
ncbi:transglycosylase SLT domain-containing protein [Streptomyces sp. NRRL B-24085]|uniref:aggregation-promoting factor C-terminal-like domain-containing protein n=1 Tax=Streptomyces sp. NRRL B-24085 TaxID=1709476 RepID=UPI0006B3A1D2|nr:transglycosylase SLT domain-containing protein [Streptomyces sp. NRRL B-24085]